MRHSKRGVSSRKTWSSSLITASTVHTYIPTGLPTSTPSPEFQNTGHPFILTINSYSTPKAQPELPLLRRACRFPLSHWLSQLPGPPEHPGYTVRQWCAGLSSSPRLNSSRQAYSTSALVGLTGIFTKHLSAESCCEGGSQMAFEGASISDRQG